jgi:hypothetical protein
MAGGGDSAASPSATVKIADTVATNPTNAPQKIRRELMA